MSWKVVAALVLAAALGSAGRRAGRGPRPLDRHRHDHAAARLLPGRHDRRGPQPLLRRRLRRALPHDAGVRADRSQRRRDPARRAAPRGLQPHRRHRLGPPGGRAHPAAARVLRPERAERRKPVPPRLDRRRRPGIAAVALLRQARSGGDPEGDVERGLARRLAAVDLEREDLLAYRTADISRANAAPEHAPIRSVRRLRGAVPPSGITGATFVGERMFVAGQSGGPFRVWSIDLATGRRRLEIERRIVGESEGLVTAALKGATLHWLIQPFNRRAEAADLQPRPRDAAELPFGRRRRPAPAVPRAGAGSGRAGSPLVYLLRRSRSDRAAAQRLRRRGAVPRRLHRDAAGPQRAARARAVDQAGAAVAPPPGPVADPPHPRRAADPAHAARAAAVDPARRRARAGRGASPAVPRACGCAETG